MRVLTWNLFHGRAKPSAGRPLPSEFAGALAGWEWDVALLQEVPPWWPPMLAVAAGASERAVLTSRNQLLPLRRAIASRAPDLLKANGGGSNAVLVRRSEVREHRERRLRRCPERRMVHGVRLAGGVWVVNVHSQNQPEALARRDTRAAAATALEWAAGAPLVFGGDVNLERPEIAGLRHLAGNHVDHLFSSGPPAEGRGAVLERGTLSDHPPVAVTVSV